MKKIIIFIGSAVIITLLIIGGMILFQPKNPNAGASVIQVFQGGTGAQTFAAGQCLVGNGTGAVTTGACGAGGGLSTHNISYHNDVSTSTLAYGHLLMWNGTLWQDTATSSLGITGSGTLTGSGSIPQLSYWTGATTLGGVATTSLTATLPLSLSQPISVLGTAASAISLSTAGDWGGTFDSQEGIYYLNAKNLTNFGTPFWTYFNGTTTSALSEGTNLYFTNGRAISALGLGYSPFSAASYTSTSTATSTLHRLAIGDLLSTPYIHSTSTATSTFAGGINMTSGCFALNGTCVGASGGANVIDTLSATLGAGNDASGLNILDVGRLTASALFATSTTATSTIQNLYSAFIGANYFESTSTYPSKITYASSTALTVTTAWFTNASSTNFSASANITSLTATIGTLTLTNALTVPNGGTGAATITGLVKGNAAAAMSAYGGTSCTNQFVRSLDVNGSASCATVGSADVSLANLSATNTTLTFSGTYNGSTARTIGLNLANGNTWTALQQFGNATSTLFTATTGWIGTLNLTNALTVANGGTGLTSATNGYFLTGLTSTLLQATSSLFINPTGTIGVATTTPSTSYKMDIYGNARIDNTNTAATSTIRGQVEFQSTSKANGCYFIFGATTTLNCY